ncbi:Transcription initiation factor TFIID [Salix suchowensis]|nr:Transcription initiation factor TFIID [Salix suchowensis]
MDLSTMGAKLGSSKYKDRFAFEADFKLMISNAKTYNSVGSYAHNEAIAFEIFFEKHAGVEGTPTKSSQGTRTAIETHPQPEPVLAPPPPPPERKVTEAPRPIIKLKVTPQQSRPVEPLPPKAPPRLKVRKPKALEPPPPYVDDGSHDILQEVIAMEREKDEERLQRQRLQQLEKERERLSMEVVSSSKRKKDTLDDDDIVRSATPAKREKPSPGPSTIAPHPKPLPPAHVTPKVSIPAKKKATEAPPKPHRAESSSSKGKEKEVAPAPTPAKPKKPPVVQATPINDKKCREILKTLKKLPEAAIFLRPVDPALDGCPTCVVSYRLLCFTDLLTSYLDEIAHPMDFGTMTQKLTESKYATMEDFLKDVELVFSNCRQFNPPLTYPIDCVEVVEKVFKKEWQKSFDRKLPYTTKRGLQAVLNTLSKDPLCWVFLEPVDPVALGVPTYFEIIPRKDARDIRTIRDKLEAGDYDTAEAFEADVHLMFANAIKFNGAQSEVGVITAKARAKFKDLMDGYRQGLRRRGKRGTRPALSLRRRPR